MYNARTKGFIQHGSRMSSATPASDHSRTTNLNKGFTLIEIIVSTGIFMTVVTVAVSALIVLNNASREARAVRVTMDNANQAIESVTRNVRMGFQFNCGCANESSGWTDQTNSCAMSFSGSVISGGNSCVAFYAPGNSGSIVRYQYRASSTIQGMERSTDRGVTWTRMTAPEVGLSSLKFYVNGATKDNDQPFLTIIATGTIPTLRGQKLPFNIQASADPRTPNSSLIYKSSP